MNRKTKLIAVKIAFLALLNATVVGQSNLPTQPASSHTTTASVTQPTSQAIQSPYMGVFWVNLTPEMRKTCERVRTFNEKAIRAMGTDEFTQWLETLEMELGTAGTIFAAEGKWDGITMPPGLLVCKFPPDSPSKDAGLAIGDVILTIDGYPVRNDKSWEIALAKVRFDRETTFVVSRSDGRNAANKIIRFIVPAIDAEEAKAAKLLIPLDVQRDPAVGRCYILARAFVFGYIDKPIGSLTYDLAICPYICMDESGAMTFRMRILYSGTEWLFAENIMFRTDKTETQFELPKSKRQIKTGFVKERSDIEVTEDFLTKLVDAQKAYVTAQGKHDRVSYEIVAENKTAVSNLLCYAQLVRQIGPYRAKALSEAKQSTSTPTTATSRPNSESEIREQAAASKLRLARMLIQNGMTDKAKDALRVIIKDFSDTTVANEAKKELEKIN